MSSSARSGTQGHEATGRLSVEHLAAVNRDRRVVVNFDVMIVDPVPGEDAYALAKERLTFADSSATRIDSIWWNWGEGNVVPYPSRFLPPYDHPGFRKWLEDGVDIVRIFLDETHKRGMEAFYSHRMNGADNDPMHVPEVGVIMDTVVQRSEGGAVGDYPRVNRVPMKEEHPDWLFDTPWSENGYWNFAVEGVRRYVLRNLREIAENYDFDGIELDFARGVVFPEGQGWRSRDSLTTFMQEIRATTLEVEEKRGRPLLLAARVPENLVGCHFDGLDVETWVRKQLVDIFTLGCRSFDVDVHAFRRITGGTPVKLYPALDDHHSCDGYCTPPIEVFRGLFSNWYRQGADGVQTFNFAYQPNIWGPWSAEPWWRMHLQAYQEMGDPDAMRYLDKTFVVQRRGGGHGPSVIPDPEDWSTPRHWYANSNMLAQLPAPLANDGKADTLLKVYVGDDVNAQASRIRAMTIRVLLHDAAQGGYVKVPRMSPPAQEAEHQIQRTVIRDWGIPLRPGKENQDFLYNSPPAKGIEDLVELRVNNALLERPSVEGGWLVFQARPNQLALGDNLVGLRLTQRAPDARAEMLIEKLEVHVEYQ